MKKPEPVVKVDETGPPKAAVAGAVGVAVAVAWRLFISRMRNAVSYTHLTLPTICSV